MRKLFSYKDRHFFLQLLKQTEVARWVTWSAVIYKIKTGKHCRYNRWLDLKKKMFFSYVLFAGTVRGLWVWAKAWNKLQADPVCSSGSTNRRHWHWIWRSWALKVTKFPLFSTCIQSQSAAIPRQSALMMMYIVYFVLEGTWTLSVSKLFTLEAVTMEWRPTIVHCTVGTTPV